MTETTSRTPDEELAAQAASGDLRSFEILIERYSRPILAFCRQLLEDSTESEDRMQEAFMKAFRGIESFDPSRSFRSWLYKIAQNACMDSLRKRRRWEDLREENAIEESDPISCRHQDELEEAIAGLPGKYRAILHYRYQLGLGGKEIALQMSLTHADVRVSLHRAIGQLRRRLTP